MSDRDSSRSLDGRRASPFAKWRMGLTFGVLLTPVIALIAQSLMYFATTWTCDSNSQIAVHAIPAAFLGLTLAVAASTWPWRRPGVDTDGKYAHLSPRSRFLLRLAFGLSVFSSAIVGAFWIASLLIDRCPRR